MKQFLRQLILQICYFHLNFSWTVFTEISLVSLVASTFIRWTLAGFLHCYNWGLFCGSVQTWLFGVAQCTMYSFGDRREKIGARERRERTRLIEKAPFLLLWIHSMCKCESEKGKIAEINGCERAGNASNIFHCCGSMNFNRKM